jgi:arabinogalactan oligomer/maltooligosaccharide transport system permease protein
MKILSFFLHRRSWNERVNAMSMNKTAAMAPKPKKKARSKNLAVGRWTPYWYILPAFVVMAFMVFYPLGYGFYLSLTDMSLMTFKNPNFIGLGNYAKLLQEATFLRTLLRTIVWTVVNVFFHVTIGLALAVLLNRKLPGKGLIRVLLIIPWAIPQYIVALTWRGMLNNQFGAINIFLQKIGFEAIPWLTDPSWTFIGAILTNIWLGFSFMMMISLGGLQSIDKEFYEAAEIDGASSMQQFRNITLPLLKPVLAPAIVLGTVWTFNMLNVILIIAGGFGNEKTQILVTEVYRLAFNFYRYGYAAAYSVVIFLILLVFGMTFMKRTQGMEEVR